MRWRSRALALWRRWRNLVRRGEDESHGDDDDEGVQGTVAYGGLGAGHFRMLHGISALRMLAFLRGPQASASAAAVGRILVSSAGQTKRETRLVKDVSLRLVEH